MRTRAWMLPVLAAVFALQAQAITVRNLGIEYKNSQPLNAGVRLLEAPELQPPFEQVALDFNLDIVGPLYWDNRIHMISDRAKVQWVGWRWELGLKPCRAIEVFYAHHSQHALDHVHPFQNFPVGDYLGFRLNIIGEGRIR